jgi:hypothetical protein
MKSLVATVDPTAVLVAFGFVLLMLAVLLGRLAAVIEATTRLVTAWIALRRALAELRR